MKRRYAILAGALILGLGAAGCGKDKEEEKPVIQVTEAPAEKPQENVVEMEQSEEPKEPDIENIMGNKTETASSLTFTNRMGDEVAEIYVRPNTEDEDEDTWGEDLVSGAFSLADGEQALYYFEKQGSAGALFDLRIRFTDEDRNECFFRKIPLYTVKELEFCMDGQGEDGIPYANYLTDGSSSRVSTLNEVKRRLGLLEESSDYEEDTYEEDYEEEDYEEEPEVTPEPEATEAPEPTAVPEEESSEETYEEDPYNEPNEDALKAQEYIGRPLDALISVCGEPMDSNYEVEPETGETGYHYYDGYTVSTSIDEEGNETVAGVW